MSDEIKAFYKLRTETNWTKRYESPYPVRRYFFRTLYRLIIDYCKNYELVLDSGCGDGVLSVLLAHQNSEQRIIAMDISLEGIERAREAARDYGVEKRMWFVVGDAEQIPFKSGSFPAVISSHVLEHLPDFDKGVREIVRTMRGDGTAIIALPVCLSICSMVQLGDDGYWKLSRKSLFAFWKGLVRVVIAWLKNQEGVQEGYAGSQTVPHIRRFPCKAIRRIESGELKTMQWFADSLLIPYLGQYSSLFLKLQHYIDTILRNKIFFRNLGNGIIMIARKKNN
ncbi:MAG: hypothetical protein A2Y62_05970 [Candidatus Fischerbacteria bacterium RBG_13_37_8]|uniref:Methyltransferase type 11 domain-containing protein n=1 Tax=Candidatus Fischerbacteria bacterium RBG_13_37_8 TaxID=1817863 RepID=A0A1F5VW86_9BACT|nr:MAG: hypothetical protein A2Y62_05970 [Candidatus Fischerbacteria bacterium RBG_13_37_8]